MLRKLAPGRYTCNDIGAVEVKEAAIQYTKSHSRFF